MKDAVAAENAPSVGIAMPTYNGQSFIAEQLDSLLSQDGVALHIYAFDDGSTDDTVTILHDYASRHPGTFTIHESAVNSGGTGLNIFQNLYLLPDSHDFVALADQDDVWLPQKLSKAVETLRRDDNDLYFSNLTAWDGADTTVGLVKKDAPMCAHDHLFGGGSAGCTYVLSNRLTAHLKGLLADVDLTHINRISHDWIIYFVARHYDFGVSVSSDALIKYRIHADGQYGAMTLGGLGAVRRKLHMLRSGFLRDQVRNALLFAREGTGDEAILLNAQGNWLRRLSMLLRYNTSLCRSRSRVFYLFFALLLFGGR